MRYLLITFVLLANFVRIFTLLSHMYWTGKTTAMSIIIHILKHNHRLKTCTKFDIKSDQAALKCLAHKTIISLSIIQRENIYDERRRAANNNQSTEVLKAGLFWCVFMHIV